MNTNLLLIKFLFISLCKSNTSIEIEPNRGNITIIQDKFTDIEYIEYPTKAIIGEYHQTLSTNTWHNCENCTLLYLNDTNHLLYETDKIESIIKINQSILEDFAIQNIDKDFVIRRKLSYPPRRDGYVHNNLETKKGDVSNCYHSNGDKIVGDEGGLNGEYCQTDLGNLKM